jgi:hypothetical protein
MSFSPDSSVSQNGYGFTETPTASGAIKYTYLKYGMLLNTNNITVYENGTAVASGSGVANVNTIGTITYDGRVVKYYQNGTLIYTSLQSQSNPLYAYVAFEASGNQFKNFHADMLLGPVGVTKYLYGTGTTSSGTLAITFSSAFSSTPNVTATISGTTPGFICVSSISTSGFTVTTYNTSGTLTNYSFNWNARL